MRWFWSFYDRELLLQAGGSETLCVFSTGCMATKRGPTMASDRDQPTMLGALMLGALLTRCMLSPYYVRRLPKP